MVVSLKDLPRVPLEEAIPVASAMYDNVANGTATFNNIARLLNSSPRTTKTKYMIWGAEGYGIIIKHENNEYSLSETGRKIVAPTYYDEDSEAKVKAILTPTIFSKFFTEYNKHPIPQETYLTNLLETKLGIPRERVEEAKEIILKNVDFTGIKRTDDKTGKEIIDLDKSTPGPKSEKKEEINPIDSDSLSIDDEIEEPVQNQEGQTWNKTCFVICPIGEEGSTERKHSDMILKHLIQPVLEVFGFSVIRADKIEQSGLITQQILENLVKARLCIADLSFNNPNVFYELGVRHLCQLPAIQIIRKGDKLPFDVSQGRAITIDTSDVYTLIDRLESAKKELAQYITPIVNNTSSDVSDDNPIKVYLPGIKVTIPR
ncbi:Hypothetical protein DEACI_0648 [Acididesulfobacillus acetoxydans]|uniref:Uncharacterized protein n=1 Tax=Acididesulfobacillus acetoxydans TaxID=1561005 RepID=A0A8S0W6N5_9FIRM|nr:hypothetical protein [Acididesulfobacillus acetoxydans]CAA7599999.1 Hypothetical protein DEACI_0648 [Acididesulfobacillus acetoxydans]CEJ05985.1 Hypothetical protein DEACI_0405 [Acididesulfobacillus acetoxydans]